MEANASNVDAGLLPLRPTVLVKRWVQLSIPVSFSPQVHLAVHNHACSDSQLAGRRLQSMGNETNVTTQAATKAELRSLTEAT